MKVAGFTFIRNAVINDYPVVEAITSILPLCDEFVVAVGNSDDDTLQLIERIGSKKIRIIKTIWDESMRQGGAVFAAETDKAFREISPDADWAFYIQGDECVHERYLPVIEMEMKENRDRGEIEGLLFKYVHFYGSYDYYSHSRRWYRREIRIVRNIKSIHSYRDAQGFRIEGRKLKVKLIDAYIYHYGWVKPPKGLQKKVNNFNQFYEKEEWTLEQTDEHQEFDYKNADRLIPFTSSHPLVMQRRVQQMNWKLNVDFKRIEKNLPLRRKLLQWFEDLTDIRLFEYRNYKIVSE